MTPEQLQARVPIGPDCPECGAKVLTIHGDERGTWTDCGHRITATMWPDRIDIARHAREDHVSETGNPPGRPSQLEGSDRKSSGPTPLEALAARFPGQMSPLEVVDALLAEVSAARTLLAMYLEPTPQHREATASVLYAQAALHDAREALESDEA